MSLPTASLTISQNAYNRVSELIQEEENPSLQLRVYITGGGCAGFQYGFMFDEKQKPNDNVVEIQKDNGVSIRVVVDPMSMVYLEGAEIDFVQNLRGSHFKINNPNAATTCSCGSSFSLDSDW